MNSSIKKTDRKSKTYIKYRGFNESSSSDDGESFHYSSHSSDHSYSSDNEEKKN